MDRNYDVIIFYLKIIIFKEAILKTLTMLIKATL